MGEPEVWTSEKSQNLYVEVYPYGDNGYDFHWPELEVYITIPKVKDNGRGLMAELDIFCPPGKPVLSGISLNLQSHQQRVRLAYDLVRVFPEFKPWDDLIEYAASETLKRFRIPPALLNISANPENKRIEYLMNPMLVLGQPTTLFSQGGKGKSIIADFIAVLVSQGQPAQGNLPFLPILTNVLYLDWEADIEVHRRYITAIEKGLGLDHSPILYMNCDLPFSYYVSHLRYLVKEEDIGLIIIDSQMAATAGNPQGMSEAQIAGQYYNELRSINCTTFTIDHVSKQSMSLGDATPTPYGSIIKYNRSRSQYELKQTQEAEADSMELALLHRKFNLGKLSKPLGIRIEFINNDKEELEAIHFKAFNLTDSAELIKSLPLKTRMRELLLDEGALSFTEMADRLEAKESSIKTICYREKKVFIKIGEKWGVITNDLQ